MKQECTRERRRAGKAMKDTTTATYSMNMYGRFPERHRPPERLPKHTRLDRPASASSNAKAMRQRVVDGRVRDTRTATQQRTVQESSGDVSVTTQRWPDPHRHPGSGPCEMPSSARPHRKPVLLRRCRQGSHTPPHFAKVFFILSQDKCSLKGNTHLQDRRRRHCASRQTIAEKYRQIGGAPLSVGACFVFCFVGKG